MMRRFAFALIVLFLVTATWAAFADTELTVAVEATAELAETSEAVTSPAPYCDASTQATSEADALPGHDASSPNDFSSPVNQSLPRGCSVAFCEDFCGGDCIIFAGRCECA